VQHLNTKLHRNREEERKEEVGTDVLESATTSNSNFNSELCKAMVCANIPWNSLNNPQWKGFLEKHFNRPLPHESTIRKGYLDEIYKETIEEIKADIGDSFIWISVDETTDQTGRMMANLIIGKMSQTASSSHLISCKELDATNHETVSRFVNSSLLSVWPNGYMTEKVLLLVTDAAPYMVKAAKFLKVFYPKMKHLTCLAHGVHRVAEIIRDTFKDVNKFISATTKVFKKAPSRISVYKDVTKMSTLPPTPVITRWGSWITTAMFYANHFFQIKEVNYYSSSHYFLALSRLREIYFPKIRL